MYKSPIEIITDEISSRITEEMDGYILRAVQECGVIVDKDELNAALRYDRQQYEKGYADAKKYQWIPCSERLPDEDYCTGRGIQHSAEVLATVVNHRADDETFVDMMVTADGEWKMVHPIDGDNDVADWCEVVAWMPLPEAYKGE